MSGRVRQYQAVSGSIRQYRVVSGSIRQYRVRSIKIKQVPTGLASFRKIKQDHAILKLFGFTFTLTFTLTFTWTSPRGACAPKHGVCQDSEAATINELTDQSK